MSESEDLLNCCKKIKLRRSKVSSTQSNTLSLQVSSSESFAHKLYHFSKSNEVFRFKVYSLTGKAYVSVSHKNIFGSVSSSYLLNVQIWLMNTVSRIINNCADQLKTSFREYAGNKITFVPALRHFTGTCIVVGDKENADFVLNDSFVLKLMYKSHLVSICVKLC